MKGLGLTAAIFVISVTESAHSVAGVMVSVTLMVGNLYRTNRGKGLKILVLFRFRLIGWRCRIKAGFGKIDLAQQRFPAFKLLLG